MLLLAQLSLCRADLRARGYRWACRFPASQGADATVLRLAHAYEQATEWHKREPAI